MTYDHGPLRTYEIQWHSGHIETIRAHQVSWPNGHSGGFFGAPDKPTIISFMGEIDGQWTLVLQALEDDIRVVRDVTAPEAAPVPHPAATDVGEGGGGRG